MMENTCKNKKYKDLETEIEKMWYLKAAVEPLIKKETDKHIIKIDVSTWAPLVV